jgi:hypothetical protein
MCNGAIDGGCLHYWYFVAQARHEEIHKISEVLDQIRKRLEVATDGVV